MKRLIAFYIFLQISNVCFAQDKKIRVPINNPDKQFEIIGKLGVKLGSIVTVKGFIVEGPFKGYQGGKNLVVQMINDSATQQLIQIPVHPYFGKFGQEPIPELEDGSTYALRVYEGGDYVGMPPNAQQDGGITIQTTSFYFRNQLFVTSGVRIDPIDWSPDQFLEREGLLKGIARNEHDTAIIQSWKWKLRLTGSNKWTDSEIGKYAEVYGKIKSTGKKDVYDVKNGEKRLIELEDQIGKTVKLRGRALNLNQLWWFRYRGEDIYVENMENLPDWKGSNHYAPMEITGILEMTERRDLDEIVWAEKPKKKKYYIVRKASWKPITELLTPELTFYIDEDE